MLLHRLFTNRLQITKPQIASLIAPHVAENLRLMSVPPAQHEPKHKEFLVSWPFAPHLLRLLEEQVLIATDAQETRDMIRILANLYKSRGESSPVLTAADYLLVSGLLFAIGLAGVVTDALDVARARRVDHAHRANEEVAFPAREFVAGVEDHAARRD